ncbi:MAG: hypothetical protein ABSE06_07120 [Anaerolineaceae bacterium]|jgi:hypothetical protein
MPKSLDLLLEYRQDGRKTWAIRFYQNGLVQEYSDSEMAFVDGKIVTHSRPMAWREIAHLSHTELEKVIVTLRQSDFFSLPGKVGDSRRIMDGAQFTWTVNLDGQLKKVIATGEEASTNRTIKLLRDMIQEVTANAFDREAGEK